MDNDSDGLIDMADPQCVRPDDMNGELLSLPALGSWGSLLLVAALAQIGALLARTRVRDRRS